MTQTSWSVDFANPVGEPGLCGPESVHWRVYRNPIALAIGGVSAVLLEFADARIRSGVWDHSTYRVDPIGRSKRTAMAALVGVYGPASAARRVIEGVNRMHARVQGATPDGTPYRALDPELLDWQLSTADRLALRAMAKVAELFPASDSPALQAPLRYGLPSTYCFKSRAAQKRLLALAGLTTAAT